MQLEPIYATALALLIDQLRSGTDSATVNVSVARLESLARLGSVRLDRERLTREAQQQTATAAGVSLLLETLAEHRLQAIDLHSSITAPEFLQLARALTAPPGPLNASMVRDLWNVRLHPARSARTAEQGPAASAAALAVPGSPLVTPSVLTALVARGDVHGLCKQLESISDVATFREAATPVVLAALAEAIGDHTLALDVVQPVLERAGDDGVRAVFVQLMAASDLLERRLLYDACLALKRGMAVFLEHLTHPQWYVVRNAVCLLGELQAPGTIAPIGRLLKHDEEQVRLAAVVALGRIGGPEAMSRIESVMFDRSAEVRERALATVFSPAQTGLVETAINPLFDIERDATVSYAVVAALGRVRTSRAAKKLATLCEAAGDDEDVTLRITAFEALAVGHRDVARALLPQFKDDHNPAIRALVARLLT